MFVLNASQCLNNLSINSIIAGLLSIRGVSVIVSYIGVRQSFCLCIQTCCQFWYIPSGWKHSLVCSVVCLYLLFIYPLVFDSNQHQRLFMNHFWSMVDTISSLTSSILLQLRVSENVLSTLLRLSGFYFIFRAMFGKMYLECIDTTLLCTDYLPLRSCEFRGLISVVCILSVLYSLL